MLELLFIVISLGVFVYSYGFTDLNLTLSSHPLFLSFIETMQKLVYFNRTLSLEVYLVFIIALFLVYFLLLRLAKLRKPSRFPWRLVVIVGLIFALAYPLLSHDVFKYLFAARMVVKYHLNPHVVSPMDVGDDTWLRFLRWIHTPSPYGPFFTILTIPSYIMGLGKFVPSLYLFKLMNLGAYLLTIYMIGKASLSLKFSKAQATFNQLFFSLNPLVLIEWLANAHNDAPMMALFIVALYLFLSGKKNWSLITLAASVAVKYVTVLLLPFYILRKKINDKQIIHLLSALFLVVPILYYTQYQSWYVTWFVVIVSLSGWDWLKYFALVYSFGGLLRYLPFVLTNLWAGPSFLDYSLLTYTLPVIYLIFMLSKRAFRHSAK